jgi:elongation factor P hydroxylase
MNLTPVDSTVLPQALASLADLLPAGTTAAAAFASIARSVDCGEPEETPALHADALALVERFGIPAIDEAPTEAFSWDGAAVRTRSEAAVLIHEVAHWQIAPPERRALPDFGLGAGPETGRAAEAEAARCVDLAAKAEEELLASLLGILWEATLGHPAIHSFIEQNWLEAWERPAAAEQFVRAVDALLERGLVDRNGVPAGPDRQPRDQVGRAATAAISIRNSGQASAETSTMADAGPSFGK